MMNNSHDSPQRLSSPAQALERAIALAGSQESLGVLIGKHQSTISKWRSGKVPTNVAVLIEKALNGQVTRQELRPDIFD